MVFFVVGGSRFPLWMRAVDTPIEVILKRRLYAIEVWIAIGGLVVYLAITEYLPQKLHALKDNENNSAMSSEETRTQ
jgi:hypothetical protein